MFEKRSESGYRPALDGLNERPLVHGNKTLMTEFRLRKGAILPRHTHPHEQTGYLVRGRIRVSIGSETYEAGPATVGAFREGRTRRDILEDSVAVEVFAPARDDYLPGRT